MKLIALLTGSLLATWLLASPGHAATAVANKPEARSVAKQKAVGNSKIRSRAKAKVKEKVKVKPKAKAVAKAKTPGHVKLVTAERLSVKDLAENAARRSGAGTFDETKFDADVSAARKLIAAKSVETEGRERLAQLAVVLIERVMHAEARGDTEAAAHLVQKLRKDLHDIGWRVQKMAQTGDPKARQATGFLLGHGVLLEKDPAKACIEFVAAAETLAMSGWDAAQCLMERTPEKAWAQLERAASHGHAAAQEWMGRRCLGEFGAKEKDLVCARDYLTQSASQGRSRAQTLLAYLLISGQGGQVDVNRAVRLYKTAAERGDAHAQNNLGEILETGNGGNKDPGEALLWYERAAESGLGPAQFNAGRLWAIGVGEKRNPAKARALLVQAEENGIAQARQVLDWLDRQNASAPRPTPPGGS